MDFLLPLWNPFIVHPLMAGLRAFAEPLQRVLSPGLAGGLAIILFTIVIRLLLLPLSLAQVRSQRAQMALQPELKALQKKFKGDREGMARAQMALYRERGVNPAAGCLPLLVQLPILFGMYSAMLQLSTLGLTLDQVQTRTIEPGRVVYSATRSQEPLPHNQFVLATLQVTPRSTSPIPLDVAANQTAVSFKGTSLLEANGTQGLTLNPGQPAPNTNPPGTPNGRASIFLRPGGEANPDGTLNRNVAVQVGKPYLVEIWVDAPQSRVDAASVTVTYDPNTLAVDTITTPPLEDLPFKSSFVGLPSLGEPDLIQVAGFGLPGVLLLLMTITSFVSQRMTTMPTDDPQQQMMMRSMAFMPLLYLFFFLNTPSGLVLYWLVSNLFTMAQQYFTTGLGTLAGDLQRLTGRDLQPRWAYVGASAGPSRNGTSAGAADETESADGDVQDITPADGRRPTLTERRPRTTAGKGRKRGRR